MRSLTLLAVMVSLASAGRSQAQDVPLLAGSGGVPVPKKTHYVQPEYPPEAIEKGLRGIVILELVVDAAGKVVSADVVRSVPPFDEAALKAVREWEYEVTKVDGKPVSVRVTVPITFSLKLPEISRQSGIPELRQGASPRFPAAAGKTDSASVTAEVTLQTDGTVAEARIMKGDSPWAEALLQAVGTWRFAPEAPGSTIAFRVEADFVGGNSPRVGLRLSGLRREETAATATATPPPVASLPEPAPPTPTVADPTGEPKPSAPPSTPPPSTPPPSTPPPSTPPPSTPPPSTPPPSTPPPSTPPPSTPPPSIAPPTAPPPAPTPASSAPEKEPSKAPVEEVLSATTQQASSVAPAAEPTAAGVSSVRDVTLGEGVPDLVKGRRPVPPPLARMAGTEGAVEVRFSVDAAGGTSVQGAAGPDILKAAAEGMVSSWGFRRTTTRRLYLAAEITFKADSALARVRTQE